MNGYWLDLALVALLVLVNGLLSGSEAAFISLGEGQLRDMQRRGGRAERAVVRLAREPNRFLATIQLGITLAGFLASAAAAVSLAGPLQARLEFLGRAAGVVSITTVTVLVTAATLVVGELAPKRLGMQYARRWAVLVAPLLRAMALVATPVVWLLGRATDLVVRVLGGDPDVGKKEPTFGELRELIVAHSGLNDEQRKIISGALEIHERALREVVVPEPRCSGFARTFRCHRRSRHWRVQGTPGHRWCRPASSTMPSAWCTCATCWAAPEPWPTWCARHCCSRTACGSPAPCRA